MYGLKTSIADGTGRIAIKSGELELAARLIEGRRVAMNQVTRHVLDLAVKRRSGKKFRLSDVETRMVRGITQEFEDILVDEDKQKKQKNGRDFTADDDYVGNHAWDYK